MFWKLRSYANCGEPPTDECAGPDNKELVDKGAYKCHGDARCINEPGSYECKCDALMGYEDDPEHKDESGTKCIVTEKEKVRREIVYIWDGTGCWKLSDP